MSREMVDSGITYIKEIPEKWKIIRIKNAFNCSKELINNDWYKTTLLSLTTKGIKEKDINNPNGKLPESFETYQKVEKNDIVMCLFDLDISAVFSGRSDYKGMISPAYKILKCKDNIDSRYAGYYFNYISFDRKYLHYSKNIRFTLNYDEFSTLPILLPPKEEQEKIANYLDKKVHLIDETIENNKKEIELLEKYKLSVIEEVVTGKLMNGAKKDVDGEWIKVIPSDWQLISMKNFFDFRKGLSITKENLVENGIPVISYGQIHSKLNKVIEIVDDVIRYVPEYYIENNKNSLVHKNDFIFADTSEDLDGSGNNIYINKEETLFAGYHSIIVSPKNKINTKYFAYLFMTDAWRSQIRSSVTGVKLFSISQKILKNATIIVPPKDEQIKICNELDVLEKNIEKVIKYRKDIIENLEEYKKSLIYEAVTGKIEV